MTIDFSVLTTKALSEELLKIFNAHPNKLFNYKQLTKKLEVKDNGYHDKIIDALNFLTDKGELIEAEKGRFKIKPQRAYTEGIIDITSTGAAYLLNEDYEDDIYIAPKNVKNALNGDKVKIYLYARKPGKRLEGEVVEIIQRAKTKFVGIIQISPRFAFLIPDSNKMLVDIFIPLQHLNKAEQGQKAIAEIIDWPAGAKNPIGRIIDILGKPGENETEMNAILVEYGFPTKFPTTIEKTAKKIPTDISAGEISKRKDFRRITTFTIDPVDAKDFDDALSIQKLDNGNWKIGIHIADVTHYVKPDSIIDQEAQERATSVYLVDRVVPMLPEELSNMVCSLRPKEDKLCFSAVFEMNEEAEIFNQWFGKTIINSNKRFTYEEAQNILEMGKGEFAHELLTLDSLAKKLRQQRFTKGAIAFEKVEVKFHLDEKGNPTGVYIKENKDSNKLIEEFMLLANRKVAELIGKKKNEKAEIPFVYRIHDVPAIDRLNSFAQFARKFGYKVNTGSDKEISQSLNKLMKDIVGKKEENVLEQLAIRTMAKAVYSTENIGHYGLAFDYYTHFTSPIRRYPDVMVHRLLERYLKDDNISLTEKKSFEEKCKHSTEMEIQASEAERSSVKYKQVQFLQDKKGQFFEGIISGITSWGLYVEIIENKCEGMIRLRDINDDFYEFDENNFCIKGRRTGKKYQLGDTVTIQIKNTDLLKKQIDMILVTESYQNTFHSPKSRKQSKKIKKR